MLTTCVCCVYVSGMKRVNVFLHEKQISELKKLAKKTGVKYSELVRRAIALFLVRR